MRDGLLCAIVCAEDLTCEGFMTGKPKIDGTTHYSECRLSKDVLTIDYHADFECFVEASIYESLTQNMTPLSTMTANTATTTKTLTTTDTTTPPTTTKPEPTTTAETATTTKTLTTTTTTPTPTTTTPPPPTRTTTTTPTPTTTTPPTTTPITTTTPPPTTTNMTTASNGNTMSSNVILLTNLGYSGIYIIGFSDSMAPESYMSNYFFNTLYYDYYGNYYNDYDVSTVVQSVVTSDGEECAGQNEVMVGVDYEPPANGDKSDQRVLCAALQSPVSLNATCQKVLMSEEPIHNMDTSSWYNWLACPTNYLIVKVYWVFNSSLPVTPYEYTAVDCCMTENSDQYYY
ncbi:hypothetical protein Pcinc_035575 [Petrolisthes cinctipes]|uniref:Uncharacterized protein n=1 Tax=Petrolisthes cinctipes TaxID=88211 RepID=A0AAE1ENK9_PETCI|nr:hypothetical protein Pcinc_035575 [Petrolisthes cinctipes]